MSWDKVIGQDRVKQILRSALSAGRLPHAYLFYGNEGVGKDAMAIELARTIQCERKGEASCDECSSCRRLNSLQHPDVRFVTAIPVGKSESSDDSPLAKLQPADVKTIQEQLSLKGSNPYHHIVIPRATTIKINSIREVRRESSMSTFAGAKRIFIISRADEMGDAATNTLLKTLEEPSGNTMLILTTSRRESLLQTITSRCQSVRFDPLRDDEIAAALVGREQADPEKAGIVARLANGSYTRALELLREEVADQRGEVVGFIRSLLGSNILTLMREIDNLASSRDREEMHQFLGLTLMWFRDALILSVGGNIINLDQQDDLKKFVARFGNADLSRVFADVERAVFHLERNGYIPLVLISLCIHMRRTLLPSRQS